MFTFACLSSCQLSCPQKAANQHGKSRGVRLGYRPAAPVRQLPATFSPAGSPFFSGGRPARTAPHHHRTNAASGTVHSNSNSNSKPAIHTLHARTYLTFKNEGSSLHQTKDKAENHYMSCMYIYPEFAQTVLPFFFSNPFFFKIVYSIDGSSIHDSDIITLRGIYSERLSVYHSPF